MKDTNRTIQARLALIKKTTAEWDALSSTILVDGEIGIEATTTGKNKIKIGDGVTTWTNLPYFGSEGGGEGKMDLVENATAGDLAGLNSDGQAIDSGIAAADVVTPEKFLKIQCSLAEDPSIVNS